MLTVLIAVLTASTIVAGQQTMNPTPPCAVAGMEGAYRQHPNQAGNFLFVDLFEEPTGTLPEQFQWIVSFCNGTNLSPKATSNCIAPGQLPTNGTRYFAARWGSGGNAPCQEAFDVFVTSSVDFAPGGGINVTYKSSVSGRAVRIQIGCDSSTESKLAWKVNVAPGSGERTLSAGIAFFCPPTTAPPSGPSGSGGDGFPWWAIALIIVLGIAVMVLGFLAVYYRQKISSLFRRVPLDEDAATRRP